MTIDQVEVSLALDAQALLAEGPHWDAVRAELIWVDIPRGTVHRFSPTRGLDTLEVTLDQPIGAAIPSRDGGLVLAVRDGIGRITDNRPFALVADLRSPRSATRMNDAKCDPQGRLWAGSMTVDGTRGAGSLYRWDGGRVDRVIGGCTIANGLGWSPDGRSMYFIDSGMQQVDVFDYDLDDGKPHRRRKLIDIPDALGVPDGMTVDADGGLWVALFGGGALHRYTSRGRLDRVFRLPISQPTSIAFGGDDLRDLYVTSARMSKGSLAVGLHAGGIFQLRPGVQGLPSVSFAGAN